MPATSVGPLAIPNRLALRRDRSAPNRDLQRFPQRALEIAACVEQPAHHRTLGAPDAPSDLLVAHAMKLAHHQDRAVLLGEAFDPRS